MLTRTLKNFNRLFILGLQYYLSLYSIIDFNITNLVVVLCYITRCEAFIIISLYYIVKEYSIMKLLQLCSNYLQYFIILYVSDYYNPEAVLAIKIYHCAMSVIYLNHYWLGSFYSDLNNALTYRAPFTLGYFAIVTPCHILAYLYPNIGQPIYTLVTIPILLDVLQNGCIANQKAYYFSLNPLLLIEKLIKHYHKKYYVK